MQIKGIKRGNTIELLEELNIPDGAEIIIKVQEVQPINIEERLQKMKELIKNWESREDFVNTMQELEREEKAAREKLYGQL